MKTKIIRTSRGLRKVRVLRSGQYRFMKMTKRKARRVRRTIRRHRRTTRRLYRRKARRKTTKRYTGGGLFD